MPQPGVYFATVVAGTRAAASENAGGPIVNVKATTTGGSVHRVDSPGRSCSVAAGYAFEDAVAKVGLVEAGRASR